MNAMRGEGLMVGEVTRVAHRVTSPFRKAQAGAQWAEGVMALGRAVAV